MFICVYIFFLIAPEFFYLQLQEVLVADKSVLKVIVQQGGNRCSHMLLEGRKKKKAKLSAKGFFSFLSFFLSFVFLSLKQFVNKKEDKF